MNEWWVGGWVVVVGGQPYERLNGPGSGGAETNWKWWKANAEKYEKYFELKRKVSIRWKTTLHSHTVRHVQGKYDKIFISLDIIMKENIINFGRNFVSPTPYVFTFTLKLVFILIISINIPNIIIIIISIQRISEDRLILLGFLLLISIDLLNRVLIFFSYVQMAFSVALVCLLCFAFSTPN